MESAKRLPELGREVLDRTGRLRFPVSGQSMSPALEPGDTAIVEPLRGQPPRAGEILLFAAEGGQPIVHRMVAGRQHGGMLLLATKGDSAWTWDPVLPETALLGRVTSVERGGRTLPLAPRRHALQDRVRGWRLLLRHTRGRRAQAD